MFSYPHLAQGPPFLGATSRLACPVLGSESSSPFSCSEIQGDSDGHAPAAGGDMPRAQRRGAWPHAPTSLGVALSLMPRARGCLSAHFQTLPLEELSWGIAFSSLSQWRSFAV